MIGRVHVSNLIAASAVHGAGLVDPYDSTAVRAVDCMIGAVDSTMTPNLVLTDITPSNDLPIGSQSVGGFASPYDVSITRITGTTFTCVAGASSLTGSDNVNVAPTVGLHIRAAAAEWDWLMVIEGPTIP